MSWSGSLSKQTTTKEQILSKIRNILKVKTENIYDDVDLSSETWATEQDEPIFSFINHFKANGGFFIYLESKDEFADCLKQFINENEWNPIWCTSPLLQKTLAHYGIDFVEQPQKNGNNTIVSLTDCESLIARTGSIVVSNTLTQSSAAYSIADVHLVVASPKQLVSNMKDALENLRAKYNNLPPQTTIISGPACNFEIECKKVEGVIGTRQLALFLIDEA